MTPPIPIKNIEEGVNFLEIIQNLFLRELVSNLDFILI